MQLLVVSTTLIAMLWSDCSRTTGSQSVASIPSVEALGFGKKKRREQEAEIRAKMALLRDSGFSEFGHTQEAADMRNYHLRKKKRKGVFRKREASLAEVLFPGVSPEVYMPGEDVYIITDLVQSKKTNVPFEYYDLPGCPAPTFTNFRRSAARHARKNLGARLQGLNLRPANFEIKVLQDQECKIMCQHDIGPRQVKWLRKLVERQYRVHLNFDQLPVLMRSTEWHYAVRGYPVGFIADSQYTGRSAGENEYFLYNHLKFKITYKEKNDGSGGVVITGFDVLPVSIQHAADGSTCKGPRADSALPSSDEEEGQPTDTLASQGVTNNPATYLKLSVGPIGEDMTVFYSYDVEWDPSDLDWADRWDVYLMGSPDDDIHFFAIVNSLMIVLFLTGAIATIMVRALRKDISAYNEMSMLEDGTEETGWKLVHGDVFRPPEKSPLLLSVMVGTGAQIGMAFFLTMVAAIFKFVNPIKKGHTLTSILVLYVLSGSVAGYISARIYKFCDAKAWKVNTLATALGLPGILMTMFTILNIFLSFAGAATAVSFLTLLAVFSLWVCVSAPLVLVGSFFGFRAQKVEVPTKTNQIARVVPDLPWYSTPPISFLLGGILPFGSVCIELFFIMSALWLHQIYYVMGFLLAVLMILAATCAQVSIVMDYLQLCGEDYRWWWKSFFNCASAGLYLFLYSLWFLASRLQLVGVLPVVVYLTYMGMISLCFALFCGCVGFLCAFWFNKTIYGAVKVD